MNKIPTERIESRKTLSGVLFTVAGVVLTSAFVGVYFVVDKHLPGVMFWLLFLGCVLLVAYSIFAGARGYEKIDQEHSYFNRQAVALLGSFLLLLLTFPFLGPEKADQQARDLGQLHQDLGTATSAIKQLRTDLEEIRAHQAAIEKDTRQLTQDVDVLKIPPGKKTSGKQSGRDSK